MSREVVIATLVEDKGHWFLVITKPSIRRAVTLPTRVTPENYLNRSIEWVIGGGTSWPREWREPVSTSGIQFVVATLVEDEGRWCLIIPRPSIRHEVTVTLPTGLTPEEYLNRSFRWVIDRGTSGSVAFLPEASPYQDYPPQQPLRPWGTPVPTGWIPGRFRTRRRRR